MPTMQCCLVGVCICVESLRCANTAFLEIGIFLCEMADSCIYPILGCPLPDTGILLSCKLSVQFPPRLLCRLLFLALHDVLHFCISGRDLGRWYVFSKCSLVVWQLLSLACFAKIVQKSHAVWCLAMPRMMLSCEYRQNFTERNFRSSELICKKTQTFGAMRYISL